MSSIACCLWYPQANGPFDKVRLVGIDSAEWEALSVWARQSEIPTLADILGGPLPAGLDSYQLAVLSCECKDVDWDTLDSPALSGFASLSLFVDMATQREGAGVWFFAEE